KSYIDGKVEFPNRDSSYTTTLNDLGICYYRMGRYADALPLLLEALENTENARGKEHAR
ncbi:unnamed protein product, partial [marine sediment metagenome]